MTQPNPQFMREAIRLSIEGLADDLGGPFGAVVVKDGRIIATGQNRVTSSCDPTAHAEVVAIRKACEVLGSHELTGCEIYSSCEPCPMCLSAIHWARIDRLWFAAGRKDAAAAGFDDELLYDKLASHTTEALLPGGELLREEALVAFERWDSKDDKIAY